MNQLRSERDSLVKDIYALQSKTAQLMCKHLKDEDVEGFIGKLKSDVLAKYCEHDESYKKSLQYIDSIDGANEEIEEVHEILNRQPKVRPENCRLYKEFEEKINGILHPEDIDLLETQSTINLIDPISKSRMTDPVKNTICNHTYDKYSIAEMMKRKSSGIRCPYQGCNNRQLFKLQDLVPDEITRQALMSEANNSAL